MELSIQEIFDRHSRRDWLAVSLTVGDPYRVQDSPLVLGCQTLTAKDVESGFWLHFRGASRAPAAFTAAEIISFLDEVFAKHGRPKVGVVVLPFVWSASAALAEMPVCREDVLFARQCGMEWPDMCDGERFALAFHVQSIGLILEWSESNVPPQQRWTPVED